MKKIFLILFCISLIGISCKEKKGDFSDPGFAIVDYNFLPDESEFVEIVNINTPAGFADIEFTHTGGGDLVLLKKPVQGRNENGYIRFSFYSRVVTTAEIDFKITQLNSSDAFTGTIHIDVAAPKVYNTLGSYLKYNNEYSDLYALAKKSSFWANIDSGRTYNNKGFNDADWEFTFFAVPNGTFNVMLDRIPAGNAIVYSIDDVTQEIAGQLIGSLILSDGVKLKSERRRIPFDSLSALDKGTGLAMEMNWGNISINTTTSDVGQIQQFSQAFLKRCKILRLPNGRPDSVLVGNGIVYKLDAHFSTPDSMYGTVEPIKAFRADGVLSMLGVNSQVKAGMNGFDPSYSLSTARNNFYGSGWWEGTMFVPYNNIVLAKYTAAFSSVDFDKQWVYKNRADNVLITDAMMQFMLDYWGAHNIGNVASVNMLDGVYTTTSGQSLLKIGDQVKVGANIANIVKKISWIDGSINKRKAIYIIDNSLY